MSDIVSKTYVLARPVDVGGHFYDRLTLSEPDVEALERIDELGLKAGVPLNIRQIRGCIAALARVDDEVVKKLYRKDFAELTEIAVPLLGDGESGAETSETDSSLASPTPSQPPIPSSANGP